MTYSSRTFFWLFAALTIGALAVSGVFFLRSNVVLFLALEGFALFLAILFVWLYRMLIKPYKIISEGMDLLKAQDFSSQLRKVNNDEANRVVELFNRMIRQLKDERLHVREQNHFLDLLINASPLGFIILDFDGHISQLNPAGLKLLNIQATDSVMGKKLAEADFILAQQLAQLSQDEEMILRPSGVTLYRCTRLSFIDRGFPHPFILIEELTHEVLKAEKKSYEGIIRMMAHEVNNSVAAVTSTLNVISDTLKDNEQNELYDVLPAVDASMNRCGHLSRFISNFAEVVKIPEPSLNKVSLNELARTVESLSSIECQRRNIRLTLSLAAEPCDILADGVQLEQVLINIVKNACEAVGADGEIRIITDTYPYSICIENNGEKISKEVEELLFTPFFTTKPTGQGIGLMFIREVLTNHGCTFSLSTVDDWTRFTISNFKSA